MVTTRKEGHMAVYKRRNHWVADYYFAGQRIRKTYPEKEMAEAHERKQKLAEFAGDDLPQRIKKITLSRFIEFHKSVHDSQNRETTQTLNTYVYDIFKEHVGDVLLTQIRRADIEGYKAMRLAKVKPVTVNIDLRVIRSLLNQAVAFGYLKTSPMKGVKLLSVDEVEPRFLTPEEGERVIGKAKGQIKTFVMVGLYTGMRKGEMFRLVWKDIDFVRGEIHVRRSKSRRFRVIPISTVLANRLKEHPRHLTSAYVFHNSDGSNWKDVRGSFNSTFDRAGVDRIRIHDMRHSFISNLVASGVDLRTVKELAGHASIQTTMRYAHLAEGQTRAAIERLNWSTKKQGDRTAQG
jgi:integrase